MNISIEFLGTRGSRPVPGKNTVIYGGNTSSVRIRAKDTDLLLDAGTGICSVESLKKSEGNIFITHTHWDHILGLPFFKPFYSKGKVKIYGKAGKGISFEKQIKEIMKDPHFPVNFEDLRCDIQFIETKEDMEIQISKNIIVKTFLNNHPNGGISYALYIEDKKISYVTDTEIIDENFDYFVSNVKNSDMIIFDSNFIESEYEKFKGWGHSTWEMGIKLKEVSNSKRIYMTHHKAERSDQELGEIEKNFSKEEGVFAAREGMVVNI